MERGKTSLFRVTVGFDQMSRGVWEEDPVWEGRWGKKMMISDTDMILSCLSKFKLYLPSELGYSNNY